MQYQRASLVDRSLLLPSLPLLGKGSGLFTSTTSDLGTYSQNVQLDATERSIFFLNLNDHFKQQQELKYVCIV